MGQPIRLLVVHDDQLHRECLVRALASDPRYVAVDSPGDPAEVVCRIESFMPHVLLIDRGMPGDAAVQLASRVITAFPAVKVLMLGLTECPEAVWECAEAGCAGYVLRHETFDQLAVRIEQSLRGETVCSPQVACTLFSRLAELARRRDGDGETAGALLTARELQILELIAAGLSNKEIASRLCLSLHTVKNHVHNLLEKLAVPGRYAAVQYAYQKRWLKP
jgi:DNA-binding NarL/FixJ family response regulator